ncbi:hypothetical protein vseg_002072 [Gypsophila vaccaria]
MDLNGGSIFLAISISIASAPKVTCGGSRTTKSSLFSSLTGSSGPSVKSSSHSLSTQRSEEEIFSSPSLKPFTDSDLKTATKNFRPDSVIGEGGFGYAFKGWLKEHTLLPTATRPGSGMVVAVKKLKPKS